MPNRFFFFFLRNFIFVVLVCKIFLSGSFNFHLTLNLISCFNSCEIDFQSQSYLKKKNTALPSPIPYLGHTSWLSGKESISQFRSPESSRFVPWARKIPWRRKWQSTPVFLPGKFHGQRILVGCSPWGHRIRHN